MSTATIGATPMALFPDGMNGPVILTNQGPYTVFLDSNSSVGVQSYPLPALASIVWDANRPLWCVTKRLIAPDAFDVQDVELPFTSTIAYTMNSGASNADRAAVSGVLKTVTNTTDHHAMGMVECGSYEQIVFALETNQIWSGGTTVGPDSGVFHEVIVTWYDTNARRLSQQLYRCPNLPENAASSGRGNAELCVDVRGDYVEIEVEMIAGTGTLTYSATLSGSSRKVQPYFNSLMQFPSSDGGTLAGFLEFASATGADYTDNMYQALAWINRATKPIHLNQLGTHIQVSVRLTGAVSTAGILNVSIYGQNIGSMAIPVNTQPQVVRGTFYVPISSPVKLLAGPDWAATGSAYITVIFGGGS